MRKRSRNSGILPRSSCHRRTPHAVECSTEIDVRIGEKCETESPPLATPTRLTHETNRNRLLSVATAGAMGFLSAGVRV